MSKYKKDMLSALIFVVVGILLFFVIPINVSTVNKQNISPRSFPYFIASGMVFLGLLLGIVTYVKNLQNKNEIAEKAIPVTKISLQDELRVVAVVIIIAVYILLFQPTGYFISTIFSATAILALLGARKIRHYLIIYAVSAGIYLCFTKLLFVMLP